MTKKVTYSFFGVCLALLITFTFLDLQFSQAIFNIDSIYGKIFEAAGEIPAALIGSFCCLLLFKTRNKEKKSLDIIGFIGYGFLFLTFAFFASFIFINYLKISILWTIPLVVAFSVALYFLSRLVDTTDRKKVIKVALIGILTFICALVVINIIKIVWNRPRFRDMQFISNFDEFRMWLIPGGRGALELDTFGKGQAYSSFPSGHVANATVIIWLTLLPTIMPKLKNKEWLFATVSFIWILLVAVSRVVMGAHFMTDTLVATCLTVMFFLLFIKVFKLKDSKDRCLNMDSIENRDNVSLIDEA